MAIKEFCNGFVFILMSFNRRHYYFLQLFYLYLCQISWHPANKNVYKKLWSLLKIFSCGYH